MDILKHGKTGADFRACREYVGWTQTEVADNLGISLSTVKKWERPLYPMEPRDFAWEWMDNELRAHDSEVDRVLGIVDSMEKHSGKTLDPVKLTMFHNNDGRGYLRPDGRSASFHNAVQREVWQILADDGHNVEFVWSSAKDKEAIW
jgi:hypothetical protein